MRKLHYDTIESKDKITEKIEKGNNAYHEEV